MAETIAVLNKSSVGAGSKVMVWLASKITGMLWVTCGAGANVEFNENIIPGYEQAIRKALVYFLNTDRVHVDLRTDFLKFRKVFDNDIAFETAQNCAIQEGISVGISSGANIAAAIELAKRPEMAGKRIVTIAASCGERYISTPLGERAREAVAGASA